MAAAIAPLHLSGLSAPTQEMDLVSELFHRINRIVPENQRVLTIEPTCKVRDAIELMRKNHYSQVPVVDKGEVLGVFSFRSFAAGAARATYEECTRQKCVPGDLPVDEFLEQFKFVRVTDEMAGVIESLGHDDGVLVGAPHQLVGILTPMDTLQYLHRVASPFVLLWESELALRALIRMAMTEEALAQVARRCLSSLFGSAEKVPTRLESMTFDNYTIIISFTETWSYFEPVFGSIRARIGARLKELGELRNVVFHFKREITLLDHQTLAEHRDWLLAKVKQAESHRRMENFA